MDTRISLHCFEHIQKLPPFQTLSSPEPIAIMHAVVCMLTTKYMSFVNAYSIKCVRLTTTNYRFLHLEPRIREYVPDVVCSQTCFFCFLITLRLLLKKIREVWPIRSLILESFKMSSLELLYYSGLTIQVW